jgi:pimeloyl-ACP methyl ester carboxylesterase
MAGPVTDCPADLSCAAERFGDVRTRTIRGDGGASRFLLLHGYSDSANGWRRVQRRLADAGYGSLAVDQPSHGEADPLDPGRPAVDQFVEFAAAAAEATDGGRPVIVVGSSLGGAHALALAQRHPELVDGVVAIGPASFDHPVWFRILDRLDPDRRPPATLVRHVAGPAMRFVAFGRPWRAPSGFIQDWSRQFDAEEAGAALRSLAHRVSAEYLRADPVDLRAIEVPVQVVWGSRDRLTSISSRRRFEEQVADLDFVTLPGVGHLPQLEVPGRTTKHLLRFASRLGQAPAAA